MVYIEGDGLAWKNRRTPSVDPTPVRALGLELALASPELFDTAYIGRPCQFAARSAESCTVNVWTFARYNQAAVDAVGEAIDSVKGRSDQPVVLVGYSGGGVIAALLSAQRRDVAALVTVAANLDTVAWTTQLQVTPLVDSLNPVDYAEALTAVPQRHLVGSRDKVVPPEVTLSYLRAARLSASEHLVEVQGYDHRCCWAENWSQHISDMLGQLSLAGVHTVPGAIATTRPPLAGER